MRYSIEPRERRYVKGYGFLSFAKSIGKNLSHKYGQKLVDSAKKSATNALKTASKRAIQKAAEATGDLKKPAKKDDELQSNNANNEIPKIKIYISTRKTTNY